MASLVVVAVGVEGTFGKESVDGFGSDEVRELDYVGDTEAVRALKLLTTKEQPKQSSELVEVIVVS